MRLAADEHCNGSSTSTASITRFLGEEVVGSASHGAKTQGYADEESRRQNLRKIPCRQPQQRIASPFYSYSQHDTHFLPLPSAKFSLLSFSQNSVDYFSDQSNFTQ